MGQHPVFDRAKLSGRVSPKDQELLVRLMEEAAELQHMCAKTLRWGWGSRHPNGGDTNEEGVAREYVDVIDVARRLIARRRSLAHEYEIRIVDVGLPT